MLEDNLVNQVKLQAEENRAFAYGEQEWKSMFKPTERKGQLFDRYEMINDVKGSLEHKEDLRIS
jgi:hypothetical protein